MSAPLNPINPGSDVKFGLWAAPESPLTIEYSLVVIEEIRHEVAEGYQRLSRGGIEVGGVLYGTREERAVRILAMRPIACEHARGPGFVFSDKDRMALHEQLLREKDDPHLDGLISLGWYLSHTRSEILLSQSDQEIYSIFFPSPWQVTLVVHPGRGGAMRAGFFVRDREGAVKSDHSYLEFDFPDRLSGFLDRPAERPVRERPIRERPEPVERQAYSSPAPEPAERTAHEDRSLREGRSTVDREFPALPPAPFGRSQFFRDPPAARRRWPWLLAWALMVLVAAVFGLRYWILNATPEPISLSVLERDGQLQIEWNHAAKPVANAVSGALQITDGADPRTVKLSRQELAAGKFTYVRKSADVEVRMTVQDADGVKTQEASRYLGRPADAPPPSKSSQDTTDLEKRRDELQAEVQRLRRENDSQAAKIQQLERLLRVLQARLGIDQTKQ